VKRAISTHRFDFLAIFALLIAAIAVTTYILKHQPSFVFGKSYYTVHAQFSEASAVTSGQGQAVTIAGVQVGQVGGISLTDGRADVTMNIYKQYAPIYKDATVLLRPRTPLKDMYLALDPGTKSAGAIPVGGTISSANTNPDVDVSEILSSLDSDARNYLVLLLAGGAQLFHDKGATGPAPSSQAVSDLSGTLKRFAPLDRDTERFATLLSERQQNLRRSIHNLNLVANSLGGVEGQLASLISSSDTNFSAIAQNDTQLEQTLSLFPGTLTQIDQTLPKVQAFSSASAVTLQALQPFARNFGPALRASRPLFRDTTPVIKNQLRPFSTAIQPLARSLSAGAAKLKVAIPKLATSIGVLNTLFNTLAYTKGGEPSYLYWGSWLAHNADSLASGQDADGAVTQGIFMGTCDELNFYENQIQPNNQGLGVILDLLDPPPVSKLPGIKTVTGTNILSCPGG
jgi:phospholipid/cholesterol/gamma-HCH transport system substrate-binding protein